MVQWDCMKQNGLLPFARLGASLALFGILLCMHMTFTMVHFLPSGSGSVMYAVYIFYFIGIPLGAVLCPLFLPLPAGKPKPLYMSLGFIAILIALEFSLRSLGFRVWFDSAVVRGIMAIPEGIETTLCYGLFYLTWLRQPAPGAQTNRTGRYCSLILGAALLSSVLACYYSIPLMEKSIAALDPLKGAEWVFNGIKWCMIIIGVFAAAGVFLMRNAAGAPVSGSVPAGNETANSRIAAVKTDWPVILRLIGFAEVFTLLNGVTDMRALPLYTYKAIYHPNYLITAAAVIILGFLAGRSISRFIRWFLLPTIILLLLFTCLPLFENHPKINITISTLVSIAHYTAWVVFTTAIVELYTGGFWFYAAATIIFSSVALAFLAPVIGPFIPDGTEYQVLFIVIATVSFMLLSFRWLLFPRQREEPLSEASLHETASLENIFRERGLSQREIEVANLLIKEGIGKQEIGERLFITPGTAKIHISKIYQKFKVKTRAEFMALFMKGEKSTPEVPKTLTS